MIRRVLAWLSHLLARWSGEEVALAPGLSVDESPMETRVYLHLDRRRVLRWTNLEAMRFKKRTGIDLWTTEMRPLDWEIEQFMEFLAVAALRDDPDVTAEQLAEHIAGEKATQAVAAVLLLLTEWAPAPSPQDGEEGAENPLVASVRSRSAPRSIGRSPRRRGASRTASSGG